MAAAIAADERLACLPNCRGADLSGADLQGAKLAGADLDGADVRDAILSTDLSGVSMRYAKVDGARARASDIRIDFERLNQAIRDAIARSTTGNLDLIRTYFYDCLPYQSNPPTPDEAKRFSKKRAFFSALQRLPMYKVRQGRLVYRGRDDQGNPFFQQKRVDRMLGLDVAALAAKHQIEYAAVLTGDSDFIPAIDAVQAEGIVAWLVHGPARTYASELWEVADNRLPISDPDFIKAIKRRR